MATYKDFKEIESRIQGWRLKFPEEQYIVRGQPLPFGGEPGKKKVSSTLYRQLEHALSNERSKGIGASELLQQEQKLVVATKLRGLPFTTDIEVLSDLQHFGGPTNCIDFTRDIRIALFFACQTKRGCCKPGELVFLCHNKLDHVYPADFNLPATGRNPENMQLVIPSPTDMNKNRALFQQSLFVRHPDGCFDVPRCHVQEIKHEEKGPILSFLSTVGVSHLSLFNDTLGLLNLEYKDEEDKWAKLIDSFRLASKDKGPTQKPFDEGVFYYCSGAYSQAIEVFSNFIDGGGRGAFIHRLRGSAYFCNGSYHAAIEDINRVGRDSWNDRDCFLLAMAYYKMRRIDCALGAINAAIDFNPYRSIYHHLRITLQILGKGARPSQLPFLGHMSLFLRDATVARIISEKIIKDGRLNENWDEDEAPRF